MFGDLGLIVLAVLLAVVLLLFLTGVWPYPMGWMVLLLFLVARFQYLKLRERNRAVQGKDEPGS